ncbi:hypothetical protein GCM10027566_06350 [Arachidicoccus ginsenosidivorans]|uniref:hypothetical protein n=1 Tax=Arachidicoccus ginsenosidivorans TaxID=496057 RepID=UPI001CEF8ADB|nr:hypothetical protein [Arachidicoccus ginsenosidivorans]
MGTTVKPIKKLVESGLLGWPLTVRMGKHTGFDWKFYWFGKENPQPQPVLKELDYDTWPGPAQFKLYNQHRVHQTFKGYSDYDSRGLSDMGQHYLDPIQYFLGKDQASTILVEVDAPQLHPDTVGTWRRITYTYADGCKIILDGEGKDTNAPYIKGPKGKLYPGFKSDIPNLERKLANFPDPVSQITTFTASVRSRRPFALNERNGYHSCTIVNMGMIALRLGRSLRFDPDKQEFIDDQTANIMLMPAIRAPYTI